jgi:CheY-like chemotaxis protein
MDIKLKGQLDGTESARQILKERELPIIFMTGNSDIETKKRASVLNPAGYMYNNNNGTISILEFSI